MPTIHQGRNGELPLFQEPFEALGMKYMRREMKLICSLRLERKKDIPLSLKAA